MTDTSVKEALAERGRLEGEMRTARRRRDELRRRNEEVQTRLKEARSRRRDSLKAAARSGSEAEVDHEGIATLESESELAVEALRLANQGARDAASEIVRLHHDRFADFAANAESLTRAALSKRETARKAYEEAHAASLKAEGEWDRIARDYNTVMGGPNRLKLTPNGMAQPAEVFAVEPPRPPQIEPVGRSVA